VKIAFLHFWTLRLPRGVETLTLSLANALAAQEHAVAILCAKRTREPLVAPAPNVRVREFPTFRYYETKTIVPFYAWALAQGRYDVVVTFFADFGEGRAFQLAASFTKFKHVLYLTFPYASAPHRYHAYKKFSWDKRADILLADAAYTAADGEKFFRRPVAVLPSGTDTERFKPDAAKRGAMRARLGFRDDDVVLLNVSALERRKGTWRVIETLPQIRAQCPRVRYLIMGEGTERANLEQRAAALGVRDAIVFGGTTSDLAGYYNAADIFVMLSDEEAGSVALLEAMASGLPVVVSDNGGFREIVNASNGVAVNIADTQAIAASLIGLVRGASQRVALGMAARAHVRDHFAWNALATRFSSLASA
jgi:glycosyltransferase involved in cell wall biosynthesis